MAWDQSAWLDSRDAAGGRALAPGARHNVWELVVHAAYWKYVVRRRLTGEKRGSFPLAGSNFWQRPEDDTDVEWQRDIALLTGQHRALRAAVEALPAPQFARLAPGSPFTYAALVRGAAAHDLYHAGQIQLLKRLAGEAGQRPVRGVAEDQG